MSLVTRSYTRAIAMLLVCALLASTAPFAQAKPLTPQTVHARILKQGTGNLVGVELENGTAIAGRIVSIGEESFGLQLHNDPGITPCSTAMLCACIPASRTELFSPLQRLAWAV